MLAGSTRDLQHEAVSRQHPPEDGEDRLAVARGCGGVAGGWVLSFIQSFDELTMTIFVATPGTTTLPVAMYNQIAQTIDPLVASVSAVLIVGTVLLMMLLDRMVGLDRILIGEAR